MKSKLKKLFMVQARGWGKNVRAYFQSPDLSKMFKLDEITKTEDYSAY